MGIIGVMHLNFNSDQDQTFIKIKLSYCALKRILSCMKTYNRGLLVHVISKCVAKPFVFNVFLGKNNVSNIPRTKSSPSYTHSCMQVSKWWRVKQGFYIYGSLPIKIPFFHGTNSFKQYTRNSFISISK